MTAHRGTRPGSAWLVALLVTGLLLVAMPARASAPVRLSFEKAAVGAGVWQGSVEGDIDGALTTVLTACTGPDPCSGTIWHVEFDWIIDAGDESFTASLNGVLSTVTGRAVMNGSVVEGFLEGAQVHEEGQLIDPGTLTFQGSIRIMPASM